VSEPRPASSRRSAVRPTFGRHSSARLLLVRLTLAAAMLVAGLPLATAPVHARSTSADLEMLKTVTPLLVHAGQQAVFRLGVENHGPDNADNTVVTDTLPAGLTYVSNNCGASFVAPTLTWNVGNMPDGAIAFCEITVVVDAAATNTSSVSSQYLDPVPGNSSASATVNLITAVPTMDEVGLLVLVVALALAGLLVHRRQASVRSGLA
jgi:uncharacterized repeat protein (TIGR01451 family)